MTEQEFRQKDSDLLEKISEYRLDIAEHELQISLDNKQVVLLEINRKDLYDEFYNRPEPPQRGLDGKVINKD